MIFTVASTETLQILIFLTLKQKCKFHPMTCHEDTKGEWRYSSTELNKLS